MTSVTSFPNYTNTGVIPPNFPSSTPPNGVPPEYAPPYQNTNWGDAVSIAISAAQNENSQNSSSTSDSNIPPDQEVIIVTGERKEKKEDFVPTSTTNTYIYAGRTGAEENAHRDMNFATSSPEDRVIAMGYSPFDMPDDGSEGGVQNAKKESGEEETEKICFENDAERVCIRGRYYDDNKTTGDKVDRDFIKKNEGFKESGYVPRQSKKDPNTGIIVNAPIGQSGVTIGYGVDLGQQSREGMKKMGVPDRLLDKFQPFFGLKKWDAVSALEKNKLSITEEDAKLVSKLLMDAYIDRTASNFFKDSNGEDFYSLPAETQTVLADLTYHHGSLKNNKSYPWVSDFYKNIIAGDYESAISALSRDKNAHSVFAGRRDKQITLLRQISRGN